MIFPSYEKIKKGDLIEYFLLAAIVSTSRIQFLQNELVIRFNILYLYSHKNERYTLKAQYVLDTIIKIDKELEDKAKKVISQLEKEGIIIITGRNGDKRYTLSGIGIDMIPVF